MQSVMWLRSHLKQGISSQKMTGSLNNLCVIVSMGITASSGPTMALSIYLVCVDCLHSTVDNDCGPDVFADKVVPHSYLSERKTGCVKGFWMERKGNKQTQNILNN